MITREVFMDIKAMNRNGLSIRRIAKITGLHRKTVKRHLESTASPEQRVGEEALKRIYGKCLTTLVIMIGAA